MQRAVILVVLALGGCAGASGWTIANGIGLGAQTAALACDWGQTRRAADAGWKTQFEHNPFIGPAPEPAVVDAYFATIVVLAAVGWYALPWRWKPIASLLVTTIQLEPILHSVATASVDLGICGIR